MTTTDVTSVTPGPSAKAVHLYESKGSYRKPHAPRPATASTPTRTSRPCDSSAKPKPSACPESR